MLIDQKTTIKNIIATQIVKIFYPFIIAQTEEGEYIKLNLSLDERNDTLFWDECKSILKAKLWVPVGRHYHQLLDNGWYLDLDRGSGQIESAL
ncbi:hypothetical protein [Secundilactobacillus collinoides]|uniref:hypothetical protein n=1 Tax=Secundilactobacillus collinoides TaxID=33960 RepID=UPI0007AE660A|nr:hypothetical protein [Secundilactobacillus collinoides]